MVVDRGKLGKTVYLLDYLLGDKTGLVEYLCTLNDSVTDGGDFSHRVYDPVLAGGEDLYKLFKGLGMGGENAVLAVLIAGGGNLVLYMAAYSYAVAVSLCEAGLVLHV